MINWIDHHELLVFALSIASVTVFIGSLLLMPALVVRIPADYFANDRRPPSRWTGMNPVARLVLRIGKNMLGYVFILAGVAMLALPGQGVLTIVLGVLLVDGPGKYRFERWLVRRRWVHRPINWLRRRRGCEPLNLGDHAA